MTLADYVDNGLGDDCELARRALAEYQAVRAELDAAEGGWHIVPEILQLALERFQDLAEARDRDRRDRRPFLQRISEEAA